MSLLFIRYENKVGQKHISALIKPQWTSEGKMEWLLMAPIFAKLPFCGLLLQGRDCPHLSHFRSCKSPKQDQYSCTEKTLQDGGKVISMFLVPTDRPASYFKPNYCQSAACLWLCYFCTLIYFAYTISRSMWLICIFVQATTNVIKLIYVHFCCRQI